MDFHVIALKKFVLKRASKTIKPGKYISQQSELLNAHKKHAILNHTKLMLNHKKVRIAKKYFAH